MYIYIYIYIYTYLYVARSGARSSDPRRPPEKCARPTPHRDRAPAKRVLGATGAQQQIIITPTTTAIT